MRNDLTQFDGHTPEPWLQHGERPMVIIAQSGRLIGRAFLADWEATKEERANIKLMAAAPSLLAEVRELRELVKPGLIAVMRNLSEYYWAAGWLHGLANKLLQGIADPMYSRIGYDPDAITFARMALAVGELPDDKGGWHPLTPEQEATLQSFLESHKEHKENP